jgi:predicted enzyme related to lactoylglutathione lyase
MKKVTGIGGAFFKAKNPKELAAWYEKHLGIPFDGNVYTSFKWKDDGPDGQTVFSIFGADSDYYAPSMSTFMFNFRVADLDALLEELKSEGVEIVGEPQAFDYGKFGWILDPEGNKIELWEPIDTGFGD